MKSIVVALGAISAALALASAPADAASSSSTSTRHHTRTGYNSRTACERAHHRSANTGTVIGAIGGGLIGNQLAGSGSRTLGTVLGAGGGAVVGHQIGANSHRCR